MSASRGPDRAAAAAAIDAFLRALGRSAEVEPDLVGTGARVADMFLDELCAGYTVDTRALVVAHALPAEAPVLVAVHDVPIVTMCPHHLLPATGHATIAFKAASRIIGLGALAELAVAHARRLTLQERIGEAVVADLDAVLAPEWVGCRLVLRHGCMTARGERAGSAWVETVALRGAPTTVAEAHRSIGVGDHR